jgi:hypothetical protein
MYLTEKAFSLHHDSNTDLYLLFRTTVKNSRKNSLLRLHARQLTNEPTPHFKILYAVLDLEVGWRSYDKDTYRYLPIRRAANESQFTLGRAFLQEVYLIADYERGNFSLIQARYDPRQKRERISIPSLLYQNVTDAITSR